MSEKHLKDYLHLYMGCEVKTEVGWSAGGYSGIYRENNSDNYGELIAALKFGSDIKLKLRHLSDMTEEEWNAYKEIEQSHPFTAYGDQLLYSKLTNYIRSIYVDVDGLIDAGLAIDKTKIYEKVK